MRSDYLNRGMIHFTSSVFILVAALGVAEAGITNWFRFDKTDNSDRMLYDRTTGMDSGHLIGESTVRTTDRPVISDNREVLANSAAIRIGNTANEGVLVNGVSFLLHSDGPAGPGDATLEFLIKPQENSTDSIFWSNTFFNGTNVTIDGHDEANRFNIQSTNFGGLGANGDFRTGDLASSPGTTGLNGLGGDPVDTWVAYALVRENWGSDDYFWRWFRNGDEVASVMTSGPLPSNINSWSIGSRGCCTLNAIVDEVRFWDEALVHQDPRFLRVEAQSAGGGGIPGDFNNDRTVDAVDYTVWQDNRGLDASILNGNGSGAATVVQDDYLLWKTNFGQSETSRSATPVPEPTALLLALLALLGMWWTHQLPNR